MRKLICSTIFIFIFQAITLGQELNNFAFSKVTPVGGVAYSSVICVGQDDLGFIWFGTNNGLFRYDSKSITRYATSPLDTLGIPTNRINNFYLDKNNNFWIATENGLCKYNRDYDNFTTLKLLNKQGKKVGKNIQSFFQDAHDKFWIVNELGVCTLDTTSLSIEYKPIGNNVRINRGYTDKNKQLWFTSYDGRIYKYENNTQEITLFSEGLKDTPRALFVDDQDVWVGYDNDGLICLDLKNGLIKHQFSAENSQYYHLSNSRVRAITKDQSGNVWVGTYNGINIINNYKCVTSLVDQDLYNIPHPSIWSFFNDSQNNIWVGTWLGGLCFYNEDMNIIYHYNKSRSSNNLSDNVISCFTEQKSSNKIWIGTEQGGIFCMDNKTHEINHITLIPKLSNINIKSLAIDKFNTIWVGTYGQGVWFKKADKTQFEPFKTEHTIGWQIVDIKPTSSGVWFANYSIGALFYSFKTQKTISYKHNPVDLYSLTSNYIRNIIEDKKGNIWLATTSGLNKFVPKENKFYHYFKEEGNPNSLSNNFIYSIHEDDNGIIWIGTNGTGLNRLNPDNNQFEILTINDGLSGNEVYTVLSDDKGLLWISTENGITSINTSTLETKNMLTEVGISNNQFNPTSGFKSNSGELYFGGSNGFIRFSPVTIKTNMVAPKAIISNFSINNREVYPHNHDSVLKNHISNTEYIELNHDQNSFSFDLVATNYLFPSKNRFKYRLIGFNDDWIETDFNGKAIYTSILPGNYTFQVIAANNDGIWSTTPTEINIDIKSPYWKRWYAYLLYFLFLSGLAYLIRIEIISKEKLKNEVTIEKIQHENEKQLNQLKSHFFTNISHEFRTPLTLILGPIERLLKSYNTDKNLSEQLDLIKNNAVRLLKLVTEIIDLRKMEVGKMELSVNDVDIIEFCSQIFSNFKKHAQHRNITYNFICDINELNVKIDKNKVDKIVYNLLSNAFKNTQNDGKIDFIISRNTTIKPNDTYKNTYTLGKPIEGDYFEVIIQDNGCGIKGDELKKIFDLFYYNNKTKYGNVGIGLSLTRELINLMNGTLTVHSEESKGSIFAVQFPLEISSLTIAHSNPLLGDTPETILTDSTLIDSYNNIPIDKKIKHKNATVLVVEDNPELCQYIVDALSPYYSTSKAKDGKQANDIVLTTFPDIIVSDIMMPTMNGFELCKNIKNDIRTSHIPVILLTALSSTEDNINGLTIGADAYIPKPFNEDLLILQIDNLIESRKKLREIYSPENQSWNEKISDLSLDKNLIQRAINIVNENLLEESFSVEILASELGLSRTHLHRKLKTITNQSASEFIRNIRLEKAKELMKKGELKINEVGFSVGFNSHTYFTKSFKKYVGLSPQEYLKNKKEI